MALTIDQYLQVIQGITFSDTQIGRTLMKNGISSGVPASDVSEQLRDLAEADMFYNASLMVNGGAYSKKINNRTISETYGSVSDARVSWLKIANSLRAKWSLPAYDSQNEIFDASIFWQ